MSRGGAEGAELSAVPTRLALANATLENEFALARMGGVTQRIAGEAEGGPFIHGFGAEAFVETDRR